MTLSILGIGTAVPQTLINQEEALHIARALAAPTPEQGTWLPGMYSGTGIHSRHLALPPDLVRDVLENTRRSGSVFLPSGKPDDRGPTTQQRMAHYARLAPPLAIRAAREAILAADVNPGSFTHLVTVSCTGFFAPGIDRELIDNLRLDSSIERAHVGFMGCHGALNGLRVARAFASAEPGARVLLCAVELCSLHYHYSWNPSKMVANALFADGAGALVGVAEASGAKSCWRVVGSGSCLLPDSAEAMTWTIGDHGFEMTLAKNVPGLIARHLRPWLERWLSRQAMSLENIRSWAVHPGGPKILGAVEEALGLGPNDLDASRSILSEFGNMSSPTVLFIIQRLQAMSAPRPCLALAFGPGLVAEAALLN